MSRIVQLVPMAQSDFERYLEVAIEDYAADHVRAGNWSEAESVEKSSGEFQTLLPDGVASKNQHLFTIVDAATRQAVGMIWYADRTKGGKSSAFVYDFRIDEPFRRKGYATAAMHALDEMVRARGILEISLHVFGDNHGAWELYEKVGYRVTDLLMVKKLDGQGNEH